MKLGVIQQLRGPNLIQFWPSILLERTIVDILQTTYPFFYVIKLGISTDHLPSTYLSLST